VKNRNRKTSFAAPDIILQEVWAARKTLAGSCGHGLDRLFAEARERRRKSGRASVNLEKAAKSPLLNLRKQP
jgi:hypothetical protein